MVKIDTYLKNIFQKNLKIIILPALFGKGLKKILFMI
jgi:hypothetical protein